MAYLAEDNHWYTNSWVSVSLLFPDISNQPEDKEMIPLPPGMPAPYMPRLGSSMLDLGKELSSLTGVAEDTVLVAASLELVI